MANGNEVIILKIGGSSITNKAREETLDNPSLRWFASLVAAAVDPSFLASGGASSNADGDNAQKNERSSKKQFIIVHGAGSFGHHSAKRYGLRCGKAAFLEEAGHPRHPANKRPRVDDVDAAQPPCRPDDAGSGESGPLTPDERRYEMEGLAKTRQSVQKLNAATVGALIHAGVNVVGISPGISFPNLHAHGATLYPNEKPPGEDIHEGISQGVRDLCASIRGALRAGLVPVVHGDACLLFDGIRGGILGGDTIAESIATVWNAPSFRAKGDGKLSRVIFISDVPGVCTADPKVDSTAKLIRSINVDRETGDLSVESKEGNDDGNTVDVNAGGSSHAHDVTGGLKAKLGAAVTIVQAGIDVVITQCGSESTARLVTGEWEGIWDVESGTLLSRQSD